MEEIGGDTRLLVLDVTDEASIADAARQVGTLDILVNNAGVSGDDKTPDLEDAGTFRRVYETNVFGVVAVTNAFLPAMDPPGSSSPGTRPWFPGDRRHLHLARRSGHQPGPEQATPGQGSPPGKSRVQLTERLSPG